ncbi:unnamed protein product [Polarella glacialis]|uniref:Uncharacterized protein n=1 Tax=Polarella glacialis TaxID=89957 RepID=A0A813JXB0_POLGL|nr:unnamed protein product [Polarella glacialis]
MGLLSKMLAVRESDRPEAKEALADAWLSGASSRAGSPTENSRLPGTMPPSRRGSSPNLGARQTAPVRHNSTGSIAPVRQSSTGLIVLAHRIGDASALRRKRASSNI